ncbi:NADH:flavin oxidoreductase [alpha proteobacterium IMCC14465]|uniref:NADH:flavin oxidoreductase n=1 Tax=alpha proteobacterium IMCC14465 TaxID=1220535 RepID=J9DEB3_9PROT|nr:NADH:flavin oxidoreductase [alpha proteobacterium IMCC14465]
MNTMKPTILFEAHRLGDIDINNRIVMAPMTRSRAGQDDEPTQMTVDYYAQRASAGLIITEGVYPSYDGKGYVRTPGIVSEKQIAAWENVCRKVHENNGKIVMQIMHCGRVAAAANKSDTARTLAPSARQAAGKMYTDTDGMVAHDVPEEMTLEDIEQTINDFANATQNAINIGFDGVELHATSGYLPAQFLSTGTNQRTDAYGGSLEKRLRFTLDVLDAMINRAGAGRVGMRICPGNPFNDLHDDNPAETFAALLDAVSPKSLAYLHVIRMDPKINRGVDNIALAQKHFSGPLILNESFDKDAAQKIIESGIASAVSFGRLFVSNPDLVHRLETDAPLAEMERSTLYTPGEKGYTDYPSL